MSPSRAPALSFTHYFQAPVAQASAFGNVELLGNAALHDNLLVNLCRMPRALGLQYLSHTTFITVFIVIQSRTSQCY